MCYEAGIEVTSLPGLLPVSLPLTLPHFQPEDSLLKHFFRQIKRKEN